MIAWMLVAAASAQTWSFPTSAVDYGEFYPTAYYDHAGVDWNCGTLRYSGHQGNDFGVGSFPGMDEGRDVVASAPGVVVETHDGEADRCTSGSCGPVYGNYVKIEHDDGKKTLYGHLAQWSVAVAVGDVVDCGQYLGLVGSSGWSTGPHLHFGAWHPSYGYVDPFDGPCSAPPS